MQEIRSKSLFAKILAKEDIGLEVNPKAKTASFRYDKRLLTLPDWDVSDYLERLFISHEVGHALFTPSDKRTAYLDSQPDDIVAFVRRVLNIVEDARIEKLILRKYPGLTKDYVQGYIELQTKFNFFDFKSTNIYNVLNTHFKVCVSGQQPSPVTHTPDETYFIEKMLKLETYEEVIDVVNELIRKYPNQLNEDIEKTSFTVDLTEEIDADEEYELEIAESNAVMQPPPAGQVYIPNFQVKPVYYKKYIKKHNKNTKNKISVNNDIIKYMQMLFKKFKNAQRYKNTLRQKTGNLHLNSLYKYKYDEKIFETKKIKPKEKNHKVILLVDGSSSMRAMMEYVAIQAYNIAEFCRLEKIPCQCFVFIENDGAGIEALKKGSKVSLLQFFDDPSKFQKDLNAMSDIATGGTPLTESLIVLTSLIATMAGDDTIINFMVITDGACNSAYYKVDTIRYKNVYVKPEINDVVSGFYKIYRDYYNVNVISFDLISNGCYNSYNGIKGVDRHFEVPVSIIKSKENSVKFLNELVEIMSV